MKLFLAALLVLLPFSAQAEEFFGVGVALEQQEGITRVIEVLANGPAQSDGRIQAGDELVSVKPLDSNPVWEPVNGLALEDVVQKVRGEEGSVVGLTLANSAGQYEVFLRRAKIRVP